MRAMRVVLSGALAGVSLAVAVTAAVAQGPVPKGVTAAKPLIENDRPVAYLHGNIAVTMEEFGKYLMDRGGADKLELFVNKRIIELEADRRKITVTRSEMEAKLVEDLKGLGATQDDFLKILLPKYNKSLYEWMEDIVRPGLLLAKMNAGEVKVSDEDLKKRFEREYGERREIQLMMWPAGDEAKVAGVRAKMMEGDAEFDTVARNQANPSLAACAGRVKPVSRHLPGEDKTIEIMAFKLREGEVSEVMKTAQGLVCIKLRKIIPQDPKVTFETHKASLYQAAFEEKLNAVVQVAFAKLRDRAAPQLLYSGPTEWKALSPAGTVLSAPSITTPGSGGSPTITADPSIRQTSGK